LADDAYSIRYRQLIATNSDLSLARKMAEKRKPQVNTKLLEHNIVVTDSIYEQVHEIIVGNLDHLRTYNRLR